MFGIRVGALGARRRPGNILLPTQDAPTLDLDWTTGVHPGAMWRYTRGTFANDMLYDGSGTGAQLPIHTPLLRSGEGFYADDNRTNNATGVTTQTITLAVDVYCLWIVGGTSATVAANTAVGSGFGVATPGTPVVFTITSAGTVDITVVGTPTFLQCEGILTARDRGPSSFVAYGQGRGVPIDALMVGSWFNPTAFTFVAEWRQHPSVVVANTTSLSYFRMDDSSTGTNRITIVKLNGGGGLRCNYVGNGVATTVGTDLAESKGSITKWGITYTAGTVKGCRNGGAVETISPADPMTGITRIGWMPIASGISLAVSFRRRVRFWNRVLSDVELQAATA